ncbi:MAG TPA: 3-deoxy-manno-octulosonate cytidylyltransferase [Rhabdochlamydiaceae bacterium]|jgi:3-deoxy-manno-octulosonate cytidylyltransferase (CMP-KDO synthetase)|nr:3-deoxy-manno-octulosonate cytidylyltransferase [Rhabdochlamydiaceae bacterium]
MRKIACVIPARLNSTRFPRKILALLHDKPLIQWVWEAAKSIPFFNSVTIAVDNEETADLVRAFGAHAIMTKESCPSGTMRLGELLHRKKIDADIFVCWQSDEPFLHQHLIGELLQTAQSETADVWTLKKKITQTEDVLSPHVCKVVTDQDGYALYFSRYPIPFYRDMKETIYYKHIGIYAYTKEALSRLIELPTSHLAEAEQLEQLNFLYHGLKVRVHETTHEGFGIDIPAHLEQAHVLASTFLTKK